MEAADAWAELEPSWRIALEEAWTSWVDGNYGIGAVLVDPNEVDGAGAPAVIATGRNRVAEQPRQPGTIAGNHMAHAEMNAYAALPQWNAAGLHLYTTLEPCLMCAATGIFLRIAEVHYASVDEFFDDLDDLWRHNPYSAERQPVTSEGLSGRLKSFARLLPSSFNMLYDPPDHPVVQAAYRANPELAELAARLLHHEPLVNARGGTALDAITALWDDLPE